MEFCSVRKDYKALSTQVILKPLSGPLLYAVHKFSYTFMVGGRSAEILMGQSLTVHSVFWPWGSTHVGKVIASYL